ncbi:hypothetical protein KUV85_11645 [Nocardioides panacisoli]|uniref:hypothetical protein n=1 Tax=Nocardioides panacisoli TaxID=627624 RepID=UPI001C634774|nr:hypothetical protein [Nocardioides panacisoli]QYJ02987.1 hypothetical protein KUV85_11645 [Nocardioides panacisoli]
MTEQNADDSHHTDQVSGAPWPLRFPHLEIDALLQRLEEERTEPGDAERLLRLVDDEARRLRTTVMRLAAGRIAEAQDEASDIIRAAHDQADQVRAVGLDVLTSRLDEADTVAATLKDMARRARAAIDVPGAGSPLTEPGSGDAPPGRGVSR